MPNALHLRVMRQDVTIHLRLPEALLRRVDEWAAERYATRSDAVRQLLLSALRHVGGPRVLDGGGDV